MADVQSVKTIFTNIAGALRTHTKSTTTYKPANMAKAIEDLVVANQGTLEINSNGFHQVGVYEEVNVNIPSDAIQGVSLSGQGKLTANASSRGWTSVDVIGLTGEPLNLQGSTSTVSYGLSNGTISLANAKGTLTLSGGNSSQATITADNLTAANIKSGVTILGVTGSLVEVNIDEILNQSY